MNSVQIYPNYIYSYPALYQPEQLAYENTNYQFKTETHVTYEIKYVCDYHIQIENDTKFQVKRRILGHKGETLKKIIHDCCIVNKDFSTKIRLRGKGSGYREGLNQEESDEPLMLCLSSLNKSTYYLCREMIENLLRKIYGDYFSYLRFMGKNTVGNVPSALSFNEYFITKPQ